MKNEKQTYLILIFVHFQDTIGFVYKK